MGDLDANNEKGQERGMHETWENRDACWARYRNEGLVCPIHWVPMTDFRKAFPRKND